MPGRASARPRLCEDGRFSRHGYPDKQGPAGWSGVSARERSERGAMDYERISCSHIELGGLGRGSLQSRSGQADQKWSLS